MTWDNDSQRHALAARGISSSQAHIHQFDKSYKNYDTYKGIAIVDLSILLNEETNANVGSLHILHVLFRRNIRIVYISDKELGQTDTIKEILNENEYPTGMLLLKPSSKTRIEHFGETFKRINDINDNTLFIENAIEKPTVNKENSLSLSPNKKWTKNNFKEIKEKLGI